MTYLADPTLEVEPARYCGGVPVFEPTMAQFADFYAFNKAINRYGMQLGIVKVVPPREWRVLLPPCPPQQLELVRIRNPIVQHISSGGAAGVYSLQNVERQRAYLIKQWRELLQRPNYQPPAPRGELRKGSTAAAAPESIDASAAEPSDDDWSDRRCAALETTYWRTLTYAEPMYGADSLGTLFPADFGPWNVAHLPNILDLLDAKLPGVNDAYLYAGLWKATFSWHLEDQDLYLINYLHTGAPKQWYSIPQRQADRFYRVMCDAFPEDSRACPEFLRHKTFMMSPKYLERHGIDCNRIVHREGEFIITYPYGYHAGFNYGFNLAELVNFALDDWFDIGDKLHKCECIEDLVGIDVNLLRRLFLGQHASVRSERSAKEDHRPKTKPPSAALARPRGRPRKPPVAQCQLCPNALPRELLMLKPFELLGTGQPVPVHRLCASAFAQVRETDGEAVGLSDISKAQRQLKCSVCSARTGEPQQGACFQCDHPKCTRSFHATCALGDGFLFDVENRCRFHRGKVVYHRANALKHARVAAVACNSVIQFTLTSRDAFAGLVVANNADEGTLVVKIYPHLAELIEVTYDHVLMSDDANADVTQNSCLLYEAPLKRASNGDLTVTGLPALELQLTIDGRFVVELVLLAVAGRLPRSADVFWHYLPLRSTETVARYTDTAGAFEPNDANTLKKLERLVKRRAQSAAPESKRHQSDRSVVEARVTTTSGAGFPPTASWYSSYPQHYNYVPANMYQQPWIAPGPPIAMSAPAATILPIGASASTYE